MARLTGTELVELVTRYRFPDRRTAIAVILGESGGDPSAINREPGNIDRGLWQISSKWHPNFSDAAAFDVNRSTQYAFQLSKGGTDFSLWNATKSRNFAGHLGTAAGYLSAAGNGFAGTTATGDPSGVGGAGVGLSGVGMGVGIGDAYNWVTDRTPGFSTLSDVLAMLGKVLGALTSRDFWTRAGYVLAGLALLLAAAYLLFMAPARRAALGAISKASPVGADATD